MKPSAWVVVALCLYLLLEAVIDTRGRGEHAHPHRAMIVAVVMTLVAAAAVLYEWGY